MVSLLLFYNVENSQNKEKPLNELVSKLLIGTVHYKKKKKAHFFWMGVNCFVDKMYILMQLKCLLIRIAEIKATSENGSRFEVWF